MIVEENVFRYNLLMNFNAFVFLQILSILHKRVYYSVTEIASYSKRQLLQSNILASNIEQDFSSSSKLHILDAMACPWQNVACFALQSRIGTSMYYGHHMLPIPQLKAIPASYDQSQTGVVINMCHFRQGYQRYVTLYSQYYPIK